MSTFKCAVSWKVMVVLLMIQPFLTACSGNAPKLKQAIVGEWAVLSQSEGGDTVLLADAGLTYTFFSDGSVILQGIEKVINGTYKIIEPDALYLSLDDGRSRQYNVQINGNNMTMLLKPGAVVDVEVIYTLERSN